jgi:hypothetical protein
MIENLLIYSCDTNKRLFSLKVKLKVKENPIISKFMLDVIFPTLLKLQEKKVMIYNLGNLKLLLEKREKFLYVLTADSNESNEFLIISLNNSINKFSSELIFELENNKSGKYSNALNMTRIDLLKSLLKITFVGIIGFEQTGRETFFNCIKGQNYMLDYAVPILLKEITMIDGNVVYLWNFVGASRFSPLWPMLLQDTNIVLLMTDSTQFNVEQSKRVFLKLIKNTHPKVHIIGLASMQDLSDRLPPSTIKEILGVEECYGLIMRSRINKKEQQCELLMNDSEIDEINAIFNQILDKHID